MRLGVIWLLLAIFGLLLIPGLWANFWLLGIIVMLLILVFLINHLWMWRVMRTLRVRRTMPEQAFRGDTLDVEVTVHNGGRLPLPWMLVQDYIPSSLSSSPRPEWLLSVRGQEKLRVNYKLECKKRGRYRIGPLEGNAGVLFDTSKDPRGERLSWQARSKLVIFPQIIPLEQLLLPSRLPLGNLRTRQPLLPDPSRIAGVREYQSGDDPRYIDWRNTARLNQLLVKQFERTRIVPLAIFLDMRPPNKEFGWRNVAEASIVVAASLAARANELKQAFGLYSNGYDPGWDASPWDPTIPPDYGRPEMSPRTGTPWLYEMLDKLAGLDIRGDTQPIEQLAGKWSSHLPWGATIALVSFEPYPDLVTEISRLRRAGFTVIAIFTGKAVHSAEALAALDALRALGVQTHDIIYPGELNLARS
jgi:hypothetical protein